MLAWSAPRPAGLKEGLPAGPHGRGGAGRAREGWRAAAGEPFVIIRPSSCRRPTSSSFAKQALRNYSAVLTPRSRRWALAARQQARRREFVQACCGKTTTHRALNQIQESSNVDSVVYFEFRHQSCIVVGLLRSLPVLPRRNVGKHRKRTEATQGESTLRIEQISDAGSYKP